MASDLSAIILAAAVEAAMGQPLAALRLADAQWQRKQKGVTAAKP